MVENVTDDNNNIMKRMRMVAVVVVCDAQQCSTRGLEEKNNQQNR